MAGSTRQRQGLVEGIGFGERYSRLDVGRWGLVGGVSLGVDLE